MNVFFIILAIAIVIGFFSALPKIFKNRKEIAAAAQEQCGLDMLLVKIRARTGMLIMALGILMMAGFLALGLWTGFYYTTAVSIFYIVLFSHVFFAEAGNYISACSHKPTAANFGYAAA